MGDDWDDGSVEVEHSSGAGRLVNGLCMAVCVAPVVIVAMCGMVGWNEQRAVCEAKALDAGHKTAQEADCSSPSQHSGSLIFATCDLQKEGLPRWKGSGDFDSNTHVGVGLSVKAEMFCCIETEEKTTSKDKIGGGKTTEKKYKYAKGWVDYSDRDSKCKLSFHSSRAAKDTCDVTGNTGWPSGAPESNTKWAQEIKVGSYTIKEQTMISQVSLKTPITGWTGPAEWKEDGAGRFVRQYNPSCHGVECIGAVRVSFYSNDWAQRQLTFAGQNEKGVVGKWTAPSGWLCSGFQVGKLKEGTYGKDDFFSALKEESHNLTMVLRLVGFLVLWMAFACCFSPCEVLLDCIPCVGPMLGDCFSAVACCVACLPATVCFLGIAGAMWCVMRPLIGIPLMILWCLFMGGLGYYVYSRKEDIGKKAGAAQQGFMPGSEFPSYGTAAAQPVMAQPVMAQPVMAQPLPRQMQVVVPPGSGPGDMVQVLTPEGAPIQAAVPPGVPPGGVFMVNY